MRVAVHVRQWENLASAIIVKAAKDYRAAYKAQKRNPQNTRVNAELRELVRFFTSPWYSELTDVDGGYLVRKLNESVDGSRKEAMSREVHTA